MTNNKLAAVLAEAAQGFGETALVTGEKRLGFGFGKVQELHHNGGFDAAGLG